MTSVTRLTSYTVVQSGSITWPIEGFRDKGQILSSPPIVLSDSDEACYLNVFPNNHLGLLHEYIILYLKYDNAKHIIFRVSLLNADGQKSFSKEYQYQFGLADQRCVFGYITRRSLLDEANGYLVNGRITIHCDVDVIESWHSSDRLINEQPLTDYRTLFESRQFSDFTLVVGGKELQVHKAFLGSRSPVFAAMFSNAECLEVKQGRVEIIDVAADVFELLLQGIYSGELTALNEHAAELLVAADKYQLEDLKAQCAVHLCAKIAIETVVDLLILADISQTMALKAQCIKFIVGNSGAVTATDGWTRLKKDRQKNADLLLELCEAFTK